MPFIWLYRPCTTPIAVKISLKVILLPWITSILSEGRMTLRWRHNGRDCVSNHQPRDCLLNRWFRHRTKKTSKLRVTGLCAGNSPGTGEFPAQRASNAENVSIWWRHHEWEQKQALCTCIRIPTHGKNNKSMIYNLSLTIALWCLWQRRERPNCIMVFNFLCWMSTIIENIDLNWVKKNIKSSIAKISKQIRIVAWFTGLISFRTTSLLLGCEFRFDHLLQIHTKQTHKHIHISLYIYYLYMYHCLYRNLYCVPKPQIYMYIYIYIYYMYIYHCLYRNVYFVPKRILVWRQAVIQCIVLLTNTPLTDID